MNYSSDRYNRSQDLTHEQATNTNKESPEYQQGYSRGYSHQPKESEHPEYLRGYTHGWNNRSMDSN